MRFRNPILALAIPSVVSNITVPLLSLVDTSIVGHMDDANNIGGIYIGSTLFSMIYWIFAFLRMGTTGIVAQARGAGDRDAVMKGLFRSLFLGLLISVLLCLFQIPLLWCAFQFVQPPNDVVASYASQYYSVCIWGAPAMLVSYSLSGWFIGMRDTRTPMYMAMLQNTVNIFMSILFVYGLKSDIRGVAAGTVIGLYSGVVFALIRLTNQIPNLAKLPFNNILDESELWRFLKVNRDLFLRTICLVIVTVSFTRFSAQIGDSVLSANAIAMQFFIFYSYFMDGLANAGEALSGEYAGRNDWLSLHKLVASLFKMGLLLAIFFTLFYYFGNSYIVQLLTSDNSIARLAEGIVCHWAWLIPIVSLSAFIWDGVFIGLTWSRGMLYSTFASLLVFFIIYNINTGLAVNSCLWLAFLLYLATRGVVQWIIWVKKSQ